MDIKRTMTMWMVVMGTLAAMASTAQADNKIGQFGLGVAMDLGLQNQDTTTPNTTLLIPIQFGQRFRMEPEVGFAMEDQSADDVTNFALTLKAGMGLFYTHPVTRKGLVTAGVRGGALLTSTENNNPRSDSGTIERSRSGFYLALVSGGEFFFSRSVSLGGEAQIGMIQLGDVKVSGENIDDDTKEEALGLSVTGVLSLRWYFL